MKTDGFILALAGAIGLALLWPELGAADGPLHLGVVTRCGIALIFFLHGANLSTQALRTGAGHWRLHILIQSTTFVVFPIMGAALWLATAAFVPDPLRLGVFYLCAISSTISSSVAMTAVARGNVAAAVFNATLSGLIGMIVTPLLVSLLSRYSGPGPTLGEAILDIVKMLLLPFAVGHLLRPLLVTLLTRYLRSLSLLDRGIIVLIVYVAFADSTRAGLWSGFSIGMFVLVGVIVLALLAAALGFALLVSRRLGLPLQDEAAAVFCGATKSLANGAPIAKIIFAGHPALGFIMLPLLLYHPVQLVVFAALARRYAVRITAAESSATATGADV
jgi:solute carrier family 10 (sodium/bile acid cotransporter), member 7